MWSLHLENIHGQSTSGMPCYHHPWKVYTIGRCQALLVTIALVHHSRSYDFGRGMPAWPLGSTHGWMTLGVGCHHLLLTAYMVDYIVRAMSSLPLEAQAVGWWQAWHAIFYLGKHPHWEDIGKVCHHRTWTTYKVGECQARHAIMYLGQNLRSNNVELGKPLSPLNNIDRVE